METEKAQSTVVQVAGVEAEACTGDVAGDMAFAAWVMALEEQVAA